MADKPSTLPELDKKRVGHRITMIRRAKDWSQKQLADLIGMGVSPQKLNNYEKGRDMIPVPIANKVCILTGVDLDFIYRGLMGDIPSKLARDILSTEKLDQSSGGTSAKNERTRILA